MATGLDRAERDILELNLLDGEYAPGVCNIGEAEIQRRRQAGYVASMVTALLVGALVAVRAPRRLRLLAALPAAGAASGFIQARERFCARLGSRGVYNFGEVGREEPVLDLASLAADRAKSLKIGIESAAVGAVVGIAAALLPIG